MKLIKKLLKYVVYVLLIPTTYIIVSLIGSFITIDRKADSHNHDKAIYLNTNGVHLEIVIPLKNIDSAVLSGLNYNKNENYLSFGWGDENFYLNTPTWGDLTISNSFNALFLNSSTLMHVTRYTQKQSQWVEIKVNTTELQQLNTYLLNTFIIKNGLKINIKNKGYTASDDFYKSKGSYSCFKTCNSWVNSGFKESGLKACLWTPFDFGLINKYK